MLTPPEELPDCLYATQPTLIRPNTPTPKHCLPLSNLDDQKFLRFSIKYLYLFRTAVNLDAMKYALSKLLVLYYPLAGRLRTNSKVEWGQWPLLAPTSLRQWWYQGLCFSIAVND
ncbi:hypothetical protein ACLB2K_014095 [Fragaria x ananassa]